jgi:transposase-like protein
MEKKEFTSAEKLQLVNDYRSGLLRPEAIEREYGISEATLNRWARELEGLTGKDTEELSIADELSKLKRDTTKARILLVLIAVCFIAYLLSLYLYPAYTKFVAIPMILSVFYAWLLTRKKKKQR